MSRLNASSSLLACDFQQTPLCLLRGVQREGIVHGPYGHRSVLLLMPGSGFNGELREPGTGHYLLGHGYRIYSPVLMRFTRPDDLSPFARGGLNAYAYCLGDPVNLVDSDGHMPFARLFARLGKLRKRPARKAKGLADADTLPLVSMPQPSPAPGGQRANPNPNPALAPAGARQASEPSDWRLDERRHSSTSSVGTGRSSVSLPDREGALLDTQVPPGGQDVLNPVPDSGALPAQVKYTPRPPGRAITAGPPPPGGVRARVGVSGRNMIRYGLR